MSHVIFRKSEIFYRPIALITTGTDDQPPCFSKMYSVRLDQAKYRSLAYIRRGRHQGRREHYCNGITFRTVFGHCLLALLDYNRLLDLEGYFSLLLHQKSCSVDEMGLESLIPWAEIFF